MLSIIIEVQFIYNMKIERKTDADKVSRLLEYTKTFILLKIKFT